METGAVELFRYMLCRLVLWYVVVNRHFVTCDDTAQRVLTFEVIAFQVTGTDVRMRAETVRARI